MFAQLPGWCFFNASFLEIFSNMFFRMLNFLRSLGLIRHLDSFLFSANAPVKNWGGFCGAGWCLVEVEEGEGST